ILTALEGLQGAERRYQRHEAGPITVVDDYGHHPPEIEAVLQAAPAGAPARILAVFQPHRYSRTRDCLDRFGPSLALADVVVLTDIYPAGEAPIDGVSLELLADAIRPHVRELVVIPDLLDVADAVADMA